MLKISALLAAIPFIIVGCGGGGGSSTSGGVTAAATATGQFKDSNTAGLSYVSGAQSGVTSIDGSFIYEVGNTVAFSVGGVTIGTSNGKSIITPLDLVPGSSTSTVEVQNIVRFLVMLDNDGDPSNGINISSSVQTMAESWPQIDFRVSDLSTELTSIMSDAASVDGEMHMLPNPTSARAHIESTLLCSYAGAYMGTFSGDDSGNFGFLIDASNGNVNGVAYSIPFDQFIGLSGTRPISYDQNMSFASGSTTTGAAFNGQFTSVNEVSGSWQNSPNSGSFSGSRIGGAVDAAFRFTGNYIGNDFGLFSFDVNASNSVTGVAYSVFFDELLTVSGTVSGNTLTATASDGTVITGTLNTVTGGFSGTWNDSVDGLVGTFSGSGCKLN